VMVLAVTTIPTPIQRLRRNLLALAMTALAQDLQGLVLAL
jgi:hypothetical protein